MKNYRGHQNCPKIAKNAKVHYVVRLRLTAGELLPQILVRPPFCDKNRFCSNFKQPNHFKNLPSKWPLRALKQFKTGMVLITEWSPPPSPSRIAEPAAPLTHCLCRCREGPTAPPTPSPTLPPTTSTSIPVQSQQKDEKILEKAHPENQEELEKNMRDWIKLFV